MNCFKIFFIIFYFVLSCVPKERTNNPGSLEKDEVQRNEEELPVENLKNQKLIKKIQEKGIYIAYRVYVNDIGKQVSRSHIQKIFIAKKQGDKEIQLKWKEVLELWHNDKSFIDFYISVLKNAPFDAYFLEFIPILGEGNNSFEFVLYETTFNNLKTDGTPFQNHEGLRADKDAISFDSSLKSSRLIVPTNKNLYDDTFAHIANFTKGASMEQQRKLWRLTSKEIKFKIKKNRKVFVSTHGKAVTWLHVRVENKSTLFSYRPYKGSH